MRRTQLIALMLVVTMAVATIPAIAATEVQSSPAPVVGASRYPTLSAYVTPTHPYRFQTYTVWGWLSWWGHPLSNRYVQVSYKFPGQTTYKYLKTVKTDAYGRYSFSSSTGAAAVNWIMKFAGDSVYYSKTAFITVHIKIPTTVSFLAVPIAILSGAPTAITYGVLAQGRGIYVTEPVSFFIDGKYAGQATLPLKSWSGVFTIPGSSTRGLLAGQHKLTASFPGNAQYAPSTNTRYINIVTIVT